VTRSAPTYLLAIDQGTTSTRAMIFDDQGEAQAVARKEIACAYPQDGWVEQDDREIIRTVLDTVKQVLAELPAGQWPLAVGIANQRETTLVWDRKDGQPIYPAIVWQDRRTAAMCDRMTQDGREKDIIDKSGLLPDPYFSATKVKWILDHVPGARARAAKGELAFGTVDSFILWHLTGGRVHATDVTNASRTMLFNIRDMAWDRELLRLFDVPEQMLPEVHACDHSFGEVDRGLFGRPLPIAAIIGDQQSALVGQGCFAPGEIKCTYGTGGFIMMNTGTNIIQSQNRLLTTVAYQIRGKKAYALEGSFFSAGSAVQWLRDGLEIIRNVAETESLAGSIASSRGVYLIPAFTGLGAPHWAPEARGALFGLTQAAGVAEIARAALESVGFQTADLLAAMRQDADMTFDRLKVDGGMVDNQWLLQFLADIMQVRVLRPRVLETTAYGAALLAGIGSGVFGSLEDISGFFRYDPGVQPEMIEEDRISQLRGWKNAVNSACYYSRG